MVVKKFVALVAKGVLHTFAGACMASFAYGCYKACTSQFVQDVLRIMEEHRSARKGLPEMYSEVEYVYPYGTPGISDGAWRLHYSKFKRHIIKFRHHKNDDDEEIDCATNPSLKTEPLVLRSFVQPDKIATQK